jgi:hypothetical protein
MDKDEITTWALTNGWRLRDGHPSLSKPSRSSEAIVRIVLKATVANLEIKKPSGKWEKVSGAPYAQIEADTESGFPGGLGLQTIPGVTRLMQDNRDQAVFGGGPANKAPTLDAKSVFGPRRG